MDKKRRPLKHVVAFALLAGAALVAAPTTSDRSAEAAVPSITMEFLGRANSSSGNAGSEIPAFDAASKRLFVTNGATKKIDIFDISNPVTPTLVKSVDLAALGATDIQSVAAKGGLVVAAATITSKANKGKLFFMNTDGTIDPRAATGVEVGYLPDSVHFTPDGKYVLSADEGEPVDYCKVNGEVPAASDPAGSVSIVDVSGTTLKATSLDFSAFDSLAEDIKSAGGRIFGPDASVAQDLEPEYVAISPDSTTAFVTLQENNAVAEVDIVNKKIVRVMGLGYKDHMISGWGLDASDRDPSGAPVTNITNWPVKGMFMPDAIGAYQASDGGTYFVTANEGDAREYPCLLGGVNTSTLEAEDQRVGTRGVDGTLIATTLADNTRLGRLGVTRFFPATHDASGTPETADASTNFTSLYSYGARSITVWRASSGTEGVGRAALVSDTGDDIESKINELMPTYFNTDWDTVTGRVNSRESRSDNKGPEPEGLAIGEVFGRVVAFAGLERIGGVIAFDVTDPTDPTYLDYLNTSVFTGVGGANFTLPDAPAGDVSPEGLLFVRASDSPPGTPLLIVAHELSGTTAIFKVVGTATAPNAPTSVTSVLSERKATVSWKAPVDDGGAKITGYTVTANPGGKTCTTTGALTCDIADLDYSTSYTFAVTATNSAGKSVAAESPAVSTATVPGAPTSVAASMSGRKATVSWKAPVGDGGAKITGYTVTAAPGGKTCTTTGALTCDIADLENATEYTFTVTATNAAGTGPASSRSSAVSSGLVVAASRGTKLSLPTAPPAWIAREAAIYVNRRRVTVALEAPASGSVSRYEVRLRPLGGGTSVKTAVNASAGQVATPTIRLKKAGRYAVTVVATSTSGKKFVWRTRVVRVA